MSTKLPRGVFYDSGRESPKRYRVRLYRNGRSHLGGYFEDLEDALRALEDLKHKLKAEPKLPRGQKQVAEVPRARFSELARLARSH